MLDFMVMVLVRCYNCYTFTKGYPKGYSIPANLKKMCIIDGHIYCFDCVKECLICYASIVKNDKTDYCHKCEIIKKQNMIRLTYNDITKSLPPEIVEDILDFVRNC